MMMMMRTVSCKRRFVFAANCAVGGACLESCSQDIKHMVCVDHHIYIYICFMLHIDLYLSDAIQPGLSLSGKNQAMARSRPSLDRSMYNYIQGSQIRQSKFQNYIKPWGRPGCASCQGPYCFSLYQFHLCGSSWYQFHHGCRRLGFVLLTPPLQYFDWSLPSILAAVS